MGEIAVADDVIDEVIDVHADNAVDKAIVVRDADLAQDLAEQTVVQLAIGRVGCAALRFRVYCESRDRSETEYQHEGQYQTQRLAHLFHRILPPSNSKQAYMEKVPAKCRTQAPASHRCGAWSLFSPRNIGRNF